MFGIGSLLISCSLEPPRFLLSLPTNGTFEVGSGVPDLVRRRKLKEPRRRECSRSPGVSVPAGENLPEVGWFDMEGGDTMIATQVQGIFEGNRKSRPPESPGNNSCRKRLIVLENVSGASSERIEIYTTLPGGRNHIHETPSNSLRLEFTSLQSNFQSNAILLFRASATFFFFFRTPSLAAGANEERRKSWRVN